MRIQVFKIIMAIGFIVMMGHTPIIHAQGEAEIIKKRTVDINGDGSSQSALLMGEAFEDGTDYYQDIWLKMPALSDKDVIHYGGGYTPSLNIIKDQANQTPLFVFKSEKEKKNTYQAHFYNEKKAEFKQMPMPKLKYIDLTIKDDYSVEIKTTPTIQPIKADIQSAPQDIKDKLFDQNGDADESASLWQSPDAHYEVTSQGEKNILHSSIPVRVQNKDGAPLGFIFTKWRFANGKWTNIETDWKHANNG